MASVVGEAVLGKVCEMALEIALRKFAEEANMVLHFREDLRWLNMKLRHVKGFLKDADQRSRHNEDVNEWLEEIRVISLLAEDICEECALESLYGNKILSLRYNKWIYRHRMERRIKGIKDRIRSIIEEGNELKLLHDVSSANEALPSTSQRVEWRRSYLPPSDSHPVGIESKVEDVLRLLNNDASPVIAVVGMGGAGKTFLLQHVYSSVKSRYEKSIWISVSQSYSISKLQKDLVFQLNDEDLSRRIKENEVSEQVLAPEIHERLQGKRCLVVLDDVWRAAREEDLLGRLGLPTGHNCPCKIVVTTRDREVCRNLHAQMYEMQCLSGEDSWSLFCVYAFEGSRINGDLKVLGRKIVKQCGNLPLAIKTVAASLANSRMPRDWEAKLQQLEGVLTANIDPVIPILRLSYDALPSHLKACFTYLSFFPEDEEIHCEYLINLWIGEGFIPAGEDQWDAAWDCLYQLSNLCLLQLWEEIAGVGGSDGLTKYCRIHDLLLDLAIRISTENKCVFSIEEASKDGGADWCRILMAKKYISYDDLSQIRPVCLRTFSLSQNRWITRVPADLFRAMRGLRVLDLSYTRISALPESIQKMKLLKVLNLRETGIEKVPECVRHLKSLLFLALPWYCRELPLWINELKCLQHLECLGVDRMPKGLSQLVSLRTLRSDWFNLSSEEVEFVRSEDFLKMSQLQELRLKVRREMELERTLARLVQMRHLSIWNETSTTELELPEYMTAMNHLETLRLISFVVRSWICDFANLRELQSSSINCSHYPELQRMSNLVRLNLYRNYGCRELPETFGKAGGFPQLRFLTIHDFRELEEFPELEEGAMACLEEFYLTDCPKLEKVGNGLELLKRLKLFKCSRSRGLQETFKGGGEYWLKIKSINPQVTIEC